MKQRMSSVDVAAEVACLKAKLLGMRLANIYDLSAKVQPVCAGTTAPLSAPWCETSQTHSCMHVLLPPAASLRRMS